MEEIKRMTLSVEYIRRGDIYEAYVKVSEKTDAFCVLDGQKYAEISNIREPFDFRMHIFELPCEALEKCREFMVTFTQHGKRASAFFIAGVTEVRETICFMPEKVMTAEDSIKRSDRGLIFEKITGSAKEEGFEWTTELYRTPAGEPVRVYTMKADPALVGMLCGTPHLAPEFKAEDIQMVMEEAQEAQKIGLDVLAATNGDFFDMFGDCHPSGLCVTQGIVVANPDSPNPFFGITREDEPVIGFLSEIPLDSLAEAIGGGQIIVKDGKVFEIAPCQGFGEISHPRTAFGIGYDGRIIAMVVDGRRPAWSNGASLSELAKLMIEHGAKIALNTDGGGSSTFIVKTEGGLEMLNHPADLGRPMEDLIRPLFDSLILYRK